MKFGDDETENEVGGKELGPVSIDLQGDQRRGQALIGPARAMLGNLKQRMQFNQIKQGSDRRILPEQKTISTLFDLLYSGELVGKDIPIDKAKKTNIEVTVNGEIVVSSIKAYGMHPDQDRIVIDVHVQYSKTGEEEENAIVGFYVHFKRTDFAYGGSVYFFVSEPYMTSGNAVLSADRYWAINSDIAYNGEGYINWDVPNGSFTTIIVYGEGGVTIPVDVAGTTPYGLHITTKKGFNHVYEKYTWNDGYSATTGIMLHKAIDETPIPSIPPLAAGIDFQAQDHVIVPKQDKFLLGWYGVGLAFSSQVENEVNSGCTFVIIMRDGEKKTFDFDFPLTNYIGPTYFLINPILGLLNQYEASEADNPFSPYYNDENYDLSFVLKKDFNNSGTPIKTIDLLL